MCVFTIEEGKKGVMQFFLTHELHMLENGAIHLRICMFHPFSRCCVHNICVLEAGPSVHV